MNTKDPIEELFRDNQHGLDEKPRDLLWDRIEERLDEKPEAKKKTKVWKYAIAACLIVGISLAGFILINQNFAPEYPEESIIVLEYEMNEQIGTEILDQLEEKNNSIATTQSHAPAPEISDSKPLETASLPMKSPKKTEEISAYDASDSFTQALEEKKLEEIVLLPHPKAPIAKEKAVFYKESIPEEIEGNILMETANFEERRLGNKTDKTIANVKTQSASADLKPIPFKLENETIYYFVEKQTQDSVVLMNQEVNYPTKIILSKNQNQMIQIQYFGKETEQNKEESKQILEYVQKNKNQIAVDLGL